MREYRVKKTDLEINLISLIDVVFLLLIFFMISSTFVNVNEVQATIQLSETSTVEGNRIKEVVLYLTKEGQVFLGEEEIEWEKLPNRLDTSMSEKGTEEVTVYADREVDFQYIVKVLDLTNRLSINQIQFSLHHR